MRKIIVALMVAVLGGIGIVNAQNSGLGFNYQAMVRKTSGALMADADVQLRISLYPGKSATTPTWVETHTAHTDASGCFGITVGQGTRVSQSVAQSFKDINFAAVYYWMKIELAENGTYREVSFSQLPSTPYSEVAHNAMLSPGMIVPFAGPAERVPDGWLLCDGRAVSRSEYVGLYRAIGICWGQGDGSTTFNLPDMRGMFLRGVSGDSGNDEDADSRTMLTDNGGNTGNNVGSYQGDAIRNITGQINIGRIIIGNVPDKSAIYTPGNVIGINEFKPGDNGKSYTYEIVVDASRVVPTGSDNRPKNVYVNYIIKF